MKTIINNYDSIGLINPIPSVRTSTSRSWARCGFLLIALPLVLACFALSPAARAVDPPPVGGYPGENTALGEDALFSYDTSIQGENTACGHDSLFNLTSGIFNTAFGDDTLLASTAGNNNTAVGWHAMNLNTTGSTNTGIGCDALWNTSTGSNNIALGFMAGGNLTTGANNIDIGNRGFAGESNTIRIGSKSFHRNTFIAGISGATVPGGIGVIIDASGHLGTVVSSERFKDQIEPMNKASEAILALKPVTFRYKHELDPDGIEQFGLVAEQVEKVNPALVARDDQGKAYAVRYESVNAMLLNEFLKEHRKVEEQEATITQVKSKMAKQEATIAQQAKDFQSAIAQQQKTINALAASLKEQASQIQKVGAQLSVSKAAPQFVVNNQ